MKLTGVLRLAELLHARGAKPSGVKVLRFQMFEENKLTEDLVERMATEIKDAGRVSRFHLLGEQTLSKTYLEGKRKKRKQFK